MSTGIALLTKACSFAAIKHRAQRRKNTETPYINHPLEVVDILASSGVEDIPTLCAGALHDTIQDTQTTEQELSTLFGEQVLKIVLECSDDKSLNKIERKVKQIEHSEHVSPKAKLVKLADKISNNRSLIKEPIWAPNVVLGYALWSDEVFERIKGQNGKLDDELHRILGELGVYKIKTEDRKSMLEEYYKNIQEK